MVAVGTPRPVVLRVVLVVFSVLIMSTREKLVVCYMCTVKTSWASSDQFTDVTSNYQSESATVWPPWRSERSSDFTEDGLHRLDMLLEELQDFFGDETLDKSF